jgi:energy-coupling factor transporter ATP-binding protein EcfA2
MFKSMRLKNFKAYKDSGEVSLAPLTVIVGANNSGKSTLFHALLALKQTALGADQEALGSKGTPVLVTKGPLVDLNGFRDIIHTNADAKASSFGISVSVETPHTVTVEGNWNLGTVEIPDQFDISFALGEKTNEIEVTQSTFRLNGKTFLSAEGKGGKGRSETLPPSVLKDAKINFRSIFPSLSLPLSIHQPSLAEYWKTLQSASIPALVWSDLFQQLHRIGPLRLRVPWYASIGTKTPSEFGAGGENLLSALGSDEPVPGTETSLLRLVNDWIGGGRILKRLHIEVDKANAGRMLLGDESHGPNDINVAGMGEGISQLLPIVAGSLGGESSCLLIEQPEIHLHPALQAELGELFIDIVQKGRRQILVETHSEHLLLRVRRRIAEGKLKPDQVAILFVEKHGGKSKVRRLDLNSRGHFSDWPKGFFDDAYQEAMALAEAASKKG